MRSVKPITLACSVCDKRSHPVKPSSPAAPMLTACEALKKDGWTFAVDFFAMFAGNYRLRCPSCSSND